MKLSELEPQFLRIVNGKTYEKVELQADAQGLMLICPVCKSHSILCWFKDRGVPDDLTPKPGRWVPSGELADLTFIGPGAASVQLMSGCNAHFFIQNGEIRIA